MRFFTHELAIDLGTANTVIFKDGEVVLDEPSIISINNETGKVVDVGREALIEHYYGFMHRMISPIRYGAIADPESACRMLRRFVRKVTGRGIIRPHLRACVAIPRCFDEKAKRTIHDALVFTGTGDVQFIPRPVSEILGLGFDRMSSHPHMTVDIGHETTEIAITCSGRTNESHYAFISTGGAEMISDISLHLATCHGFHCNMMDTAEMIKKKIGSALDDLPGNADLKPIEVVGPDLTSDQPKIKKVELTYHEIATCIEPTLLKIEHAIENVLNAAPDYYQSIENDGVWLTGGGSLLRGISERFSRKFNIHFHVADDPLKAVARGTCLALGDTEKYPFRYDRNDKE